MPAGLIPLMLSPSAPSFGPVGPRTSFMLLANRKFLSSPGHKRNASDIPQSTTQLPKPPRTMKRQSQQAPASLPVLPYTPVEWRKAIDEIKVFHATRRYRACSARCNEILSNIKDTSMVEPAYMIYLRFYAATSLEMCARPLPVTSSYRTNLLQQARSHYDKASALIQIAEESAISQSRSSSVASSVPSLQSPAGSVSSSASTMSRDNSFKKRPSLQQERRSCQKPKKSVSFELPKDKQKWSFKLPEPIVRPDSPTLGFDDEYFTAAAMRPELPKLPTKRNSQQDLYVDIRIDTSTTSPPSMPAIREEESPCSPFSSSSEDNSDDDSYMRYDNDASSIRSIARYCETLSYLKTQVVNHRSSLDSLLEQNADDGLESLFQTQGSEFHRLSVDKRNSICSGSSLGFASSNSSLEDARILDRRARIDRLRMTGWKRQRFDASRYQELCDAVLAELS